MKKRLCLFILFLTMGLLPAMAQTPTTQGKEFWVSFMRNGYRSTDSDNNLILIASAKHACTVTVTSPSNPSWSAEGTITHNNGTTTIDIPDVMGYNDQKFGIANKGLFVQATDTISLYIANETQNSYDAANVLPVQALGCKYMVQTNKSLHYPNSSHNEDNRASFLIVATEDETEVQINPTCQPMGQGSGPYPITLQRGQCYHVLNLNPGYDNNGDGDFSGTLIESLNQKPIAVFNGNSVTSVAASAVHEGYDHVFEQAMPVEDWGKRFVVTKTLGSENLQDDRVKITALFDNTNVMRDGQLLYNNMAAGESRDFWLTGTNCYLESSGPVAVYLYNHSHSSSNNYGDPSMVWISPIEQTLEEVTFSTFAASNGLNHFVNIVCYTPYVSGMTLDQNNISTSFREVSGAEGLSYARIALEHGAHTLRCPGGFIAHVYGNGDRESYAYTVGSSAKNLTAQLFVDGNLASDLPEGYSTCPNEEVHFNVETNYEIGHVEWNFGDDSNGEGEEIKHSYPRAGDFEVKSMVFHSESANVDTMTVVVHVNEYKQQCIHETVCSDTYSFHGETYQLPIDINVIVPNEEGCDSLYHLQIDQGQEVTHTLFPLSTCGSFEWLDGTVYQDPGSYHLEYIYENASMEGCDSIVTMELTINYFQSDTAFAEACYPYNFTRCNQHIIADTTGIYVIPCEEECKNYVLCFTHIDPEIDTVLVHACDSFYWEKSNTMYYDEGMYEYIEVDEFHPSDTACSTYWYLDLKLGQSAPFDEIKGLPYVAQATSFWPGQYVYHVDTANMDTQLIEWELSDNEDGEWGFHPHGGSCTIVTYTKGSKELVARISGDDNCPKETPPFTITCGGYDVEEMDDVSLKVYPNPAKDELIVEGNELINICLYNILGQKIKESKAVGESRVRMDVSDLQHGLYLVNVITRHGNKTQQVSVIK